MNIETIFDSVEEMEQGIKEIYQCFLEYFYDHAEQKKFWEEMVEGEGCQIDMLDRCKTLISAAPHPVHQAIGRDVNYKELLSIIEKYKKEIAADLDINRALKIAFHLELLEIQGIFNEIIKLPQEPYFEILTEMHLETRRNMGNLISGIEKYSYDEEFLHKVRELKSGIIEKRSGIDRRAARNSPDSVDRRNCDRRQERLVKIVCKI